MRRIHWIGTLAVALAITAATWLAAAATAQTAGPQTTEPKLTAEQQKQLENLKQLEGELEKARAAMHAAITEYGWDSEEADEAQENLFRVRQEYRKQRRALRQAGVAVPPPGVQGRTGFGPGSEGWQGGRGTRGGGWYGPGPRGGYGRHHGWKHHGCPCCGW
jgi:hypothetical protein